MTGSNEKVKKDKDDTFWAILNAALELEFRKGHLKWTMTELSRKSDVTRSLIYYYFGREKIEILNAAVKIIGEEFIGLNEKRVTMWQEGKFYDSLKTAREFYEKTPYLSAFYLTYRNKPNEIGQALLQLEKGFLAKLRAFAPKASEAEINTLFAIYFGMGFSPFVGEKEVEVFAQYIKTLLKR